MHASVHDYSEQYVKERLNTYIVQWWLDQSLFPMEMYWKYGNCLNGKCSYMMKNCFWFFLCCAWESSFQLIQWILYNRPHPDLSGGYLLSPVYLNSKSRLTEQTLANIGIRRFVTHCIAYCSIATLLSHWGLLTDMYHHWFEENFLSPFGLLRNVSALNFRKWMP